MVICALAALAAYELLSDLNESEKVPLSLEQKNHRILNRDVEKHEEQQEKSFAFLPDFSKLKNPFKIEVQKEEEVKKNVHTIFEKVPSFFKLMNALNNQSSSESKSSSKFPSFSFLSASLPENFSIMGRGFFGNKDAKRRRRQVTKEGSRKCNLSFSPDMNWIFNPHPNLDEAFLPFEVNFVSENESKSLMRIEKNDKLENWLTEQTMSNDLIKCLRKIFYDPSFKVDCSRKNNQVLCAES